MRRTYSCRHYMCHCIYLGYVDMRTIRPWLLRIIEFSFIESVMGLNFRFIWGYFWTKTHNIFSGWIIDMKSHIASMDNIGRDCRHFFFQDGPWRYTSRNLRWELGFKLRACDLQKLWIVVHGFICDLIQKAR